MCWPGRVRRLAGQRGSGTGRARATIPAIPTPAHQERREALKCQAFESPSPWQRVGTKGRVVSRLRLCKAERRKGIFYLWGGSIGEPGCTHAHNQIEVLRLCPPLYSQSP